MTPVSILGTCFSDEGSCDESECSVYNSCCYGGYEALSVMKSAFAAPIQSATVTGLDAFIDELFSLGRLSDEDETFYIVDLGVVVRRYQFWCRALPRVEPHYAVKCNSDPALLSLLAALGAGFDCASQVEIDAVLDMGVSRERIVYANPCKFPSAIKHARRVGVSLTTFDTESELLKTKEHYPGAELMIRIRADDASARCCLGNKYGCEEDEYAPLLEKAKELGLNIVGVAFHVGSNASDPEAFRKALQKARKAFDIAKEVGHSPRMLDIGGGFSGGTDGSEGVLVGAVAPLMNQALELLFPVAEGVRVIAEPGRYFAEAIATLVTRVFGRRVRPEESNTHAYWIGDGIYGSMNCLLYDHAVLKARAYAPAPKDKLRLSSSALRSSTVFGPTCDGLDKVLMDYPLPELDVGDRIIFPGMGAYTTAASTSFNGFSISTAPKFYVVSQSDV